MIKIAHRSSRQNDNQNVLVSYLGNDAKVLHRNANPVEKPYHFAIVLHQNANPVEGSQGKIDAPNGVSILLKTDANA
jgi:hypothetical protein